MLMISALFVSCSKGSDSNELPSNIVNPSFDVEQLYGTWKMDKASTDDVTYIDFDTFAKVKYGYSGSTTATFNKGTTYSGSGLFGNGSGTYDVNRNVITTYIDGKILYMYKVISLSNGQCKLIMSDTKSTTVLYFKCVKQ